jgi:hypothetical protein
MSSIFSFPPTNNNFIDSKLKIRKEFLIIEVKKISFPKKFKKIGFL